MSEIVLALTTVPAEFDTLALAHQLLGLGVAACVTTVPSVQSVYKWEGAIQTDREQQLVIKTTRGQVDGLWAALRDRHPYQVPEFVVIPVVGGNAQYLEWVRTSVSPAPA